MSKVAGVTQASIGRAIKAATRAGLAVVGIEQLPGGGVRILTDKAAETPMSDLERWRARQGGNRAA